MTGAARHFWRGMTIGSAISTCMTLLYAPGDTALLSAALLLLMASTVGYMITARPGRQ
jgi:hypothetical protein